MFGPEGRQCESKHKVRVTIAANATVIIWKITANLTPATLTLWPSVKKWPLPRKIARNSKQCLPTLA